MKKVFSTYKFLEVAKLKEILFQELIEVALKSWVPMCEGKTLEECNYLGFKIHDEWLVNKDEYRPYER